MTSFEFDVPATAANLGPGFGVLALAVDLPLHVKVDVTSDKRITIERRGTVAEMRLDARHDAILRGVQETAERFDLKVPAGLHIVADSRIPPASGIGSHTASFAAGVGIALRFAKRLPDPDLVLDLLVDLGGDPGHGAAALVGGLTAACQISIPSEPLHFSIVPQTIHPAWRFVLACPEARISTADMRRILPPTLPHAITPRTSSRLLGLLHVLEYADEDHLASFLFDEVHVPYRRRLAPGMEAAMKAAREAGAAGVTITGHGPGLIALTTAGESMRAIAEAMAAAFQQAGQIADTFLVKTVTKGAMPTL